MEFLMIDALVETCHYAITLEKKFRKKGKFLSPKASSKKGQHSLEDNQKHPQKPSQPNNVSNLLINQHKGRKGKRPLKMGSFQGKVTRSLL